MMTDFAIHRGYKFAEIQGPLPEKLQDVMVTDGANHGFMERIGMGIDLLFEDYGMSFVPHVIRYLLTLGCITCPCWIMILIALIDECDKDEKDIAMRSSKLFREQRKKDRE